MLALFFLFIIVAIALGIIGFVVHGLLWLLVIGALVLVVDLVLFGAGLRGGRRRSAR